MKYRLSRRRVPMALPKLTVQRALPWPVRAFLVAAIGLAGAAAMWAFENGPVLPGADPHTLRAQLSHYKSQIETLSAERDQYSATANAAESQLNIERSAQKQLAAQMKVLESENVRLKEDLAFFESLLPNATGPEGITIRRLKIDQIAPNQVRYRLLIMQGGKGDQFFTGNLQLSVNTLQTGKSAMMVFPEATSADQDKFKLRFRHYQRVEGILTLPEGSVAKLVQARVLDKGQVRAQMSANF